MRAMGEVRTVLAPHEAVHVSFVYILMHVCIYICMYLLVFIDVYIDIDIDSYIYVNIGSPTDADDGRGSHSSGTVVGCKIPRKENSPIF